MQGTSGDHHFFQPSCSKHGRLPGALCSHDLSIFNYEDYATPLENLFQCFTTSSCPHTHLTSLQKKFFPLCFNCDCSLTSFENYFLSFPWATLRKSLAQISLLPWSDIITWVRSSEPFPLQAEQSQLSQPPFIYQRLQFSFRVFLF